MPLNSMFNPRRMPTAALDGQIRLAFSCVVVAGMWQVSPGACFLRPRAIFLTSTLCKQAGASLGNPSTGFKLSQQHQRGSDLLPAAATNSETVALSCPYC
jgi:hypothetical protein